MSHRKSGVLLHPTSLHSPFMIGDIGVSAMAFVDWLARAKVGAWQLLPLSPPDEGGSPYSSRSAFACDPLLICLQSLSDQGLLSESELSELSLEAAELPQGQSYRDAAQARHGLLLQRAVERWLARGAQAQAELQSFRERAEWLGDAALFEVIGALQGGAPWWRWPAGLRDRAPRSLKQVKARRSDELERYEVIQLLFDQQWRALKARCAERGVELIGDMPIYVDHNSADVWAHPQLFALIEDKASHRGEARFIAGVPPDAFSEVGQRWGNPLYRWDRMKASGYSWWIARLSRALELTDRVRIDHFRALSAYWEIPASSVDARQGRWVEGPGLEFFDALRAALGDELPLIAEDLGLIDEPVRALLEATGLPGMKVLQFAFGDGPDNLYLPHRHVERSVVYTGTHDNNTTRGWWEGLDDGLRHHVSSYLKHIERDGPTWGLVRAALASVASLAIIPAQDLLNLDQGARMNSPGIAEGNWRWRLRPDELSEALASSFCEMNQLYGRAST